MGLHQALLRPPVQVIGDDEHREGITADGAAEEEPQGTEFRPLNGGVLR
jgi:hypothetical protein